MDIKKLNEAIQEAKEAKIKPIKAIEPTAEEKAFLDEMSKKIENEEGISYGELAELQSLQPQIIFINDIRLAEWAGIPEEVWNISGIDESAETEKKVMKESEKSLMAVIRDLKDDIDAYDREDGADITTFLNERLDRLFIYNEDTIDLWKEVMLDSSADMNIIEMMQNDIKSYILNELAV